MLTAVDLSAHNTISDWDALCAFADILIFKCTEGSPEGIAYADPQFAGRLAEARRRGKLIGAYHYVGSSIARRVYSPNSEADWFAAHYVHQPGEVVIYDYEPLVPPADPDGWLAAAMGRSVAKGWPVPVVYMNTSTAAASPWARVRALNAGLWIARYFANTGQVPAQQPSPGSFGGYAMWQYTSNGQVPGVAGPCDVSLFYGGPDAWRAYGGATAPTPQEVDLLPDERAALLRIDAALAQVGDGNAALHALQARDAATGANLRTGEILTAINTQVLPALQQLDAASLVAAITKALPTVQPQDVADLVAQAIEAKLPTGPGLTPADVKTAVQQVFAAAAAGQ